MIQPTIAFIPDGKGDNAKLRCRVSVHSKVVCSFVVAHIDVSKWSREAQRCKKGTLHTKRRIPASDINDDIQEYESCILEVYRKNDEPTVEQIKSSVAHLMRTYTRPNTRVVKEMSAYDYYDEFVREQGPACSWTDGTYTKFRTIRAHLKNFKEDFVLSEVSVEFLDEFAQHLLNNGLKNNTTKKDMACLKWFLRWCFGKGYITDQKILMYKCRLKVAEVMPRFLLWDELMTMWNAEIPETSVGIGAARDVFCFCAFSSLRYSDAVKLRWEDIVNDEIVVMTKKTTEPLRIQLNKYTREILERRKGEATPLVQRSNAWLNKKLKKLGEKLKYERIVTDVEVKGAEVIVTKRPLKDAISTHDARRTFICHSLMLGIPPTTVMQWTGHADYDAMKPYIAVADKAKKDAMALFDKIGVSSPSISEDNTSTLGD